MHIWKELLSQDFYLTKFTHQQESLAICHRLDTYAFVCMGIARHIQALETRQHE